MRSQVAGSNRLDSRDVARADGSVVFIDLQSSLTVQRASESVNRVFIKLRAGAAAPTSPNGSPSETERSESVVVALAEELVLEEASRRMGRRVDGMTFERGLRVTRHRSQTLDRFVRVLVDRATTRGDGGSRARLEEVKRVLVQLLLDTQPESDDEVDWPRQGGPAVVRRADELIHADLGRPLTAGEIAAHAGVSARTLFRTYRRYRGRSPIQALREARMAKARAALLSSEPCATVTEIALRCGFTHLGRFSESYKRAFGESPSDTLRRVRDKT